MVDLPYVVGGKGRNEFVSILLQHWCHDNCNSRWDIEVADKKHVKLGFETKNDLVKFHLSRQYHFIEHDEVLDRLGFCVTI